MSTLQTLGTKITAAATKLEIDGELVLTYLHTVLDHVLGLEAADAATAKAHIETVVKGAQAAAADVQADVQADATKVEADVKTDVADAETTVAAAETDVKTDVAGAETTAQADVTKVEGEVSADATKGETLLGKVLGAIGL